MRYRRPHRPFPHWSVAPAPVLADEIERRQYHRLILRRTVEARPVPAPEPERWSPRRSFAFIVAAVGVSWAALVTGAVVGFRLVVGG